MLSTIITIFISGLLMLSGLSHRWSTDSGFRPSPLDSVSLNQSRNLQTIYIRNQALSVEVAQTPSALTQGLSGRSSIGSDGMLFILPSPQIAQFWMKDMWFDLDFIWISQAQIVGITPDVPQPRPNQVEGSLPIYSSPPATDMVLEVPAGLAKTYGWQEGDQVVLW